MERHLKSWTGIALMLVFMLPIFCQGENRVRNNESAVDQHLVPGSAALGEYVFIDKHLTLHSSYGCHVFDTLYQVHIVDTAGLKRSFYFSYCSHCVSLKQYKQVLELVAFHIYKVGEKEYKVARADVPDFLEDNPEAVFVKKKNAVYVSWNNLKDGLEDGEEKFPLLKKGLNKVKDALKK